MQYKKSPNLLVIQIVDCILQGKKVKANEIVQQIRIEIKEASDRQFKMEI